MQRLSQTILGGEAVYWSRSRNQLWHKGATSGLVQAVREIRIDDDQDAVWLRVTVAGNGASCHVGYRSCFYRSVPINPLDSGSPIEMNFTESEKVFDPKHSLWRRTEPDETLVFREMGKLDAVPLFKWSRNFPADRMFQEKPVGKHVLGDRCWWMKDNSITLLGSSCPDSATGIRTSRSG